MAPMYSPPSTAADPQRPPTDSHTLLWYKFNEAAGAAAIINYGTLGAAKNLTVSGAPFLGQGGPFDSGMYVDSGGYAYGADDVEPANLTISAWVRRLVNANGWLVTKGYQAGAVWGAPWYSASIEFWSSVWEGVVTVGGAAKLIADTGTPGIVGERYYLVLTHDGVNVKFYVNGKLRGSLASGVLDYGNHGRWNIGQRSSGGEPALSIFDDVQICDVARDAAWILNAYDIGRE